jgi:hypothetical protein
VEPERLAQVAPTAFSRANQLKSQPTGLRRTITAPAPAITVVDTAYISVS